MILCDQVLHHTHSPNLTLKEFSRVLKPGGRLLTYVYRKKALPRELLDDYFRTAVNDLTDDQIWDIARGMTELGKLLTENDIVIDLPEITSLGIRGGRQSLQRYLYWNFFKCFWNEALGFEASLSTNYDWYSPSIAFRYTKHEFLAMLEESGFEVEFFHEEQACYSGRFRKINQK
jgi:ubiquinone/menaquinone biosynthesis C-methylase UbiE